MQSFIEFVLAGTSNLTGPVGPDLSHVVSIDFKGIWPFITVENGSSLTLKNLVVQGLASSTDPAALAVEHPDLRRVWGLTFWPTINAEPGGKVG